MKRKKSKLWSWSTGDRGKSRVRACERRAGGALYLEVYEPSIMERRPAVRRMSLRHTDREAAQAKALEISSALRVNAALPLRDVTLGELFEIYEREVTPSKAASTQRHDRHAMALFLAAFGAHRPVRTLNRRDWDWYVHNRRDGKIVLGGTGKSAPVRNRVIEQDLKFLLAVLNWATRSRDDRRGELLERNPLAGLPVPREESPNRPMLSQDEYGRMLASAAQVSPMFESFLVVAHETGHRGRSVQHLRWSDVSWETCELRWRAETDKVKNEHSTPLTREATAALQRVRRVTGHIGDGWVFPHPDGSDRPIPRERLNDWWLAAEKLSDVPHVRGRGIHSLRRKFATDLRGQALKDLQRLGGWKDHNTILKCYQQPDMAAMRSALEKRGQLAG